MRSHLRAVLLWSIFFFAVGLLASLWSTHTVVWAQSAAASGQIVGQVLDPSSGAVAGGEVTVRNTNTNYTRTTTTDGEGRYAIPQLPLGPYEVAVKATGFARGAQEAYV